MHHMRVILYDFTAWLADLECLFTSNTPIKSYSRVMRTVDSKPVKLIVNCTQICHNE